MTVCELYNKYKIYYVFLLKKVGHLNHATMPVVSSGCSLGLGVDIEAAK